MRRVLKADVVSSRAIDFGRLGGSRRPTRTKGRPSARKRSPRR
jgi:hypothetical protein